MGWGSDARQACLPAADSNMAGIVAREVRRARQGVPPTVQLNQPTNPRLGQQA